MQIKFALLFTVGMCACGQAQVSPLIDSSVFENGLSPPIVALPNDAVVDGKSLSEWTVEWWKWVFAIHTNENPEFDLDGSRAATHQSDGPVFFVAGVITFSGSATRHFQVPARKYLFFPVLNVYSDNVNVIPPEPIEQLRADNAAFLDAITDLKARIDGVAVPDLFAHRIISPVFSFDFTFPDNLESYATGAPIVTLDDPIASDGYWLMIEPLAPGTHVLNFGGSYGPPFNFSLDIMDTIIVLPPSLQQEVSDLLRTVEAAADVRWKARRELMEELGEAVRAFSQNQLRKGLEELRDFRKEVREELSRTNAELARELIPAVTSIIQHAKAQHHESKDTDD